MIASSMKAARVHKQGDDLIHIDDVPVPQPSPGQLLIKVEAAGVNFSDVKRRRGDLYPFETEFPFIPGGEIAGTVVAHGQGVTSPPIGSRNGYLPYHDAAEAWNDLRTSYLSDRAARTRDDILIVYITDVTLQSFAAKSPTDRGLLAELVTFSRAYLRATVNEIRVTGDFLKVSGNYRTMANLVAANGQIEPDEKVRRFIPVWRPLRDSNPCYYRERVMS